MQNKKQQEFQVRKHKDFGITVIKVKEAILSLQFLYLFMNLTIWSALILKNNTVTLPHITLINVFLMLHQYLNFVIILMR